jgi:uncharacterized iron-regulated protein
MKTVFFIFLILCLNHSFAGWNQKIINVSTRSEVSKQEFIKSVASASVIVIGEKHYTKEVQELEAEIMEDVILFKEKQDQFTFHWEFLNASFQTQTANLFQQVKSQEISIETFLQKTQGTTKASVYAPLIEVTARLGGKLFGGNLSREEKAPVTQNGLGALDPRLLPPEFQLGGEHYLERFTEIMSGHASPQQISNYFAAQCLVDDAIAYHLLRDTQDDLKFLVIGAFHSHYNDGVVARLKVRNPLLKIKNIEIIDAQDYSETELLTLFTHDTYGDRADFIYFLNEPSL